jgi:cysteine desulfurase / selenocysteine lyase
MNAKIKKDFPFLASKNLIYFDNAATTHKPQQVIDAITKFYSSDYATIHRSIYKLSEQATQHFEHVRQDVAEFIGAKPEEIIFTQALFYYGYLVFVMLWMVLLLGFQEKLAHWGVILT